MFAFFPWYTRDNGVTSYAEFTLGSFSDHRPAINLTDGHRSQLCRIVRAFRAGGAPSGAVTLVRFDDLDWNAELNEERRAALFVFAELLAMGGIASRTLFEPTGYQNRDTFRLFIQSYDGTAAGVTITSRRRDGHTTRFWSADGYQVGKPDHVHLSPNRIDEPLLNALLRLRNYDAHWAHCFDAVVVFNLANTDRSDIAVHLESVLLISAFERLLECGSNEHALAAAVTEVLRPSSAVPACNSKLLQPTRYANIAKCSAVREAWIRDFFRLRGSLAHGNVRQGYTPAWSAQAHMLLGSVAFPLALKRVLQGLTFYEWTESDQEELDSFEGLLCEDLFAPTDGDGQLPWARIRSECAKQRRLARALKAFEGHASEII